MFVPVLSRRVVLCVVGLGALALGSQALAHPPLRTVPRPQGFRMELETESGQRLRRYLHRGVWFVLGTPGERYAIRLTNPTPERVEAVVSVDGRDAISGRRGNYFTERGYVIPAHGSIRIEGFRSSLEEVRTFRFVRASASYSARMGTPENVGIIGVAFFRERLRPPVPLATGERGSREIDEAERKPSDEPREQAPASPGSQRAPRSKSKGRASGGYDRSNIGTEYGERRESRSVETPFERRTERPEVLLTVRYDDADGLTARGIELYPEPPPRQRYEPPQAFPDSRFAPPPP